MIFPRIGEELLAYLFFSIIPAVNAVLPAFTASFIAYDISIGSIDLATEELRRTASKPSSMTLTASLGLPIPASTIILPLQKSLINSRLCSFLIPRPEPID